MVRGLICHIILKTVLFSDWIMNLDDLKVNLKKMEPTCRTLIYDELEFTLLRPSKLFLEI